MLTKQPGNPYPVTVAKRELICLRRDVHDLTRTALGMKRKASLSVFLMPDRLFDLDIDTDQQRWLRRYQTDFQDYSNCRPNAATNEREIQKTESDYIRAQQEQR